MVSAAPTQGTPDLRVTNVLPHRAHQSSALRSGNSRVPFQRQIVEVLLTQRERILKKERIELTEFPCDSFQEVHGIPKPYDFGYNIQDEYGNNQFRQESSNSQGVVKGSYGLVLYDREYRVVYEIIVKLFVIFDDSDEGLSED